MERVVETYFAPAERKNSIGLLKDIEFAAGNPVIDLMLKSVSGMLAVLNEERQILAVNDKLLDMLGIEEGREVLGLRPGEAIKCVHSNELPGGCGTGRLCSSCGAAIAIVATLGSKRAEERDCVIEARRNGGKIDLHLRVRAFPLVYEKDKYILLFIQNITDHQRRAALERVFFHDINNTILALDGFVELFDKEGGDDFEHLLDNSRKLIATLKREVEIQRIISSNENGDYIPEIRAVGIDDILREIQNAFSNHPAARGKLLKISRDQSDLVIKTDRELLLRVLTNMLVNALEATDPGGEVRFWTEREGRGIFFRVWNEREIPAEISRRVFQRHFSTKPEPGRGFGTYSMKLFGEEYLEGQVSFKSSRDEGTVFTMRLEQ